MSFVVYDIECLSNCFTYTAMDIETKDIYAYVIHESRNDYKELKSHLAGLSGMIGYNNLDYDSRVLNHLSDDPRKIYQQSQNIINDNDKTRPKIKQLDLYRINHYDNQARRTSLKALQCSMDWPSVQEMPIKHYERISADQIEEILKYNLNDVLSTYEFYTRCLKAVDFRKKIKEKFGFQCTNLPDSTIGESIFLKVLEDESGLSKNTLMARRKFAMSLNFKDCILPYVEFNGKFQKVLEAMRNFTKTTSTFAYSINNGADYEFGEGGIHASVAPGVYTGNIRDVDVKSFYPNLAIRNQFSPSHIPREAFCGTYENIFDMRVAAQQRNDTDQSNGLKLALNATFGKTKSEWSPLYCLEYFYSITLNGQLLLAMLIEKFLEIPTLEVLQANTDGVTIRYDEKYHQEVLIVEKNWQNLTKLQLEFKQYTKLAIRDVNNYIAIDTDGKVKKKGAFEDEPELHKDPTYRIVKKAVVEYFVHNTSVEKTIRECQNIYLFCGRYKGTEKFHVEYTKRYFDKVLVEEKINFGKIFRYLITRNGGEAIKSNGKKSISLQKGKKVTPFNDYYDFDFSNLDYDFYIKEAYKLIDSVKQKQFTLAL